MIERKAGEGHVRTDAARYVDHHRQEASRTRIEKYEKLLETIKFLQTKQNGLMTAMKRKNKVMNGVSKEGSGQVSQGCSPALRVSSRPLRS